MIYAHLALISHLAFIPGFYDGHTPVKLLFVLGVSVYVLIDSASRISYQSLPLFWPIMAFLGVSLLSLGNVINWNLFIERLSLQVSGFVLFWVIASGKPNARQVNRVGLTAIIVLVGMWVSEFLFPEEKGVMGNLSFNAIATIQLAWFIAAASFHEIKSRWWSLLLLVSLLWLGYRSDAAILTTIIVGMVGVMFVVVNKKDISLFAASIPLVFIVGTFLLMSTSSWQNQKVQQRVAGWKNTISMSGDNFFGIGAGQFEIRYPEYVNAVVRDPEIDIVLDYDHGGATQGLPTRMQISRHPHNEYILFLVEYGPLGLIAYSILLSFILYSRREHDFLSIGLALSLIATLSLSVFWFPLTHPSMAASFWIMAGLYVGYDSNKT